MALRQLRWRNLLGILSALCLLCRHLPFYATEKGPNVAALRRILLTYAVYDFNLGYCQVRWGGSR